MNFSLKRRIFVAFLFSLLIVLVMGLTSFFFLNKLSNEIQSKMGRINVENTLNDAVRVSTIEVFKKQRVLLTEKASLEDIKELDNYLENLRDQLSKVEAVYKDVEMKKSIANMLGKVESTQDLIEKSEDLQENFSPVAVSLDGILDSYSKIVDKKFNSTQNQENQIRSSIGQTKNQMLWTLILTSLGTLLISMVIPGKISLPFRKISDAIRELQECNFDVSIYYNQNDEIGQLSREINKMIGSLKTFEELRTDRISVELRKFDTLANLVKKNVLVSDAEGKLVYLNNSLYSLLNVKSDDVIDKQIKETILPKGIKDAYEVALKRRTKIENESIEFKTKRIDGEEVLEEDFNGFANIVPIRGKESSLDYYIMIISEQMFA